MASPPHLLLLLFLSSAAAATLSSAVGRPFHLFTTATTTTTTTATIRSNPLSPSAFTLRYWDRKIPLPDTPHPNFLLNKLSPLSAAAAATFVSAAAAGTSFLTPQIISNLCSAANLLCSPSTTSLDSSNDDKDSNFAGYENTNFSNYGTGRPGGLDSFKNYSDDLNIPVDSFRRYSRNSVGHDDKFSQYEPNGNVVTSNFTSYATGATGGASDFTQYATPGVNVPNLKFTNYDADSNGRKRDFTSYSDQANVGEQSFSGYGKDGNGVPETFTSYGNSSNVVGSTFTNYGKNGNGANDTFTSYGFNGNVPENNFRSYGDRGNGGVDSFSSYRDQSNVGDDRFQSYGKNENAATVKFTNYGNSANPGSDSFKGYGVGDLAGGGDNITFKSYSGDNTSFKSYSKTAGVSFKSYKNASGVPEGMKVEGVAIASPLTANHRASRWVEQGKFFRESELRTGNVMAMPDIRDRMPARSFLPRSIAKRLPFDAQEMRTIFKIPEDTAMGEAMAETVAECERAPSRGETKTCPTSLEDMVDFTVSVLGNNAVVRSTENAAGSKSDIEIGKVKGINGGRITKSVSCHQSLFPYLVYYCHSVPKVRVYEADILDTKTKEKINHGVAICHLDTSDWSAGHGAFVALGHKPGEIEVCHWIFQGDMTWAEAD